MRCECVCVCVCEYFVKVYLSKVYLSKVYFSKLYLTCVSSKRYGFILEEREKELELRILEVGLDLKISKVSTRLHKLLA